MRLPQLFSLLLASLVLATGHTTAQQEVTPATPAPEASGSGLLDEFNQELEAQDKPSSSSTMTLADALKALDVIEGKFPDDPVLLLKLGFFLTNNDRVAEAYAVADRLDQNPGKVAKGDRLYLRHMIAYSERKFEEALALILQAQPEDPDSYRNEFSRCQCLFLLYRFEEAEAGIADLVRNNPRAASSMSNLLDFQRYTCLVKLGKADTEEAMALVGRYDYLSNDPVYYAKQALHRFEAGDRAGGVSWMNSLEQIYPATISQLYLDCFFELGYLPHWNYPDRAQFDTEIASDSSGDNAAAGAGGSIPGPAGSGGDILVPPTNSGQ